jgi:hypothetical protein
LANRHPDQPPYLTIMRTIWSKWTQAWWRPLSCLWQLLTQSSLAAWLLFENLWSEWTQSWLFPWSSCSFSPSSSWASLLDSPWLLYIMYIHCILSHSATVMQLFFSILHCLIPFVQLFHLQLLFDYCSITFQLLFIILILEIYSRYFNPQTRELDLLWSTNAFFRQALFSENIKSLFLKKVWMFVALWLRLY